MCTIATRSLTLCGNFLRREISSQFLSDLHLCRCFSSSHYHVSTKKYGLSNQQKSASGTRYTGLSGSTFPAVQKWNLGVPGTHFERTSNYSSQSSQPVPPAEGEDPPKLTLFQKYKKMLKEYWYVLVPVHCATSAIWFGSFYYASTCGVDIVPMLEYLGLSETLIKPFRGSSLGHIAFALALYKFTTPARYTVTLGGTTLAIRVLTKRGLIKPMPSKERMKEMVKQKRDDFIQRKTSR